MAADRVLLAEGRSAGYETEWVACGVLVNAPPNQLPSGARSGRDVLTGEDPARGEDPLVSSAEVPNQNVEMH